MERMGLTPVAARVFVYLLFSEEHQATFEQMVTYFRVSKSAVSNALKMLESVKMVGSRTVGGQRKRYFYVSLRSLFGEDYITARIKQFITLLDGIRVERNVKDDFSQELADVASLYKMMLFEIPLILERWRRTVEMNKER